MKTKFLATALALLLTIPLLSGCGKQDPNAPSGFQTASNDKMEYSLFVPSSWIVDTDENSMMISARASEYISTNISMIAYANEDYVVEKDENGKDISPVPKYWSEYQKDLEKIFDTDKDNKTTFVLNEEASGKTTLVGGEGTKKPATGYTYVYSGKLGGVELQYMQVIIYQKNTFYLFTYTSIPDQYEEYMEDVEAILSYIELP
ncbi:MAG: hypothetical protein J6R82_05265 [Clostridia bacterium]|nr:hypothetical protein [Clostridia bacterium]